MNMDPREPFTPHTLLTMLYTFSLLHERHKPAFAASTCLTAFLIMLGADTWYKLGMQWNGWGKE